MYLTTEQCLTIVTDTLARHGVEIQFETDVTELASGLGVTGDDEFFLVSELKEKQLAYKSRAKRIKLLEKTIAEYDSYLDQEIPPSPYTNVFKRPNDLELLELIQNLKILLDTERAQHKKPRSLPVNRPTSAKNAGAELMYKVLAEHGVGTWKACTIIAEMMIEAGTEDRPVNQAKRSLYDKLQRLVR